MFTEPAIGTVTLFGGNFQPRGWAFCQGQLMSISQNSALFVILGTTYGGDGVQTFALPDLRGRVAIHAGQGSGLSKYVPGQPGGNEQITFTAAQIAGHTHTITGVTSLAAPASSVLGTLDSPTGNVPAQVNGAPNAYSTASSDGQNLATADYYTPSGAAGTATPSPVPVLSPYLVMNYIICLDGVFPTQG